MAAAPPFFKTFLYYPSPSNRPKNCLIKCSLILSSETLTLLNFASRKRCMLHFPRTGGFIPRGGGGKGGGEGGNSAPSF